MNTRTPLPPAEAPCESGAIVVRGAATHNLQGIDVAIPRGKLVVITGPSGSGKSSLAFDTIFAEGQRQFLESLSIQARQFVEQLPRPAVESIQGLQPTVAIDQRPGRPNPRGTVATVTEIYHYLRLLMARVGQVCCPGCGAPLVPQTPSQIVELILALPEGTKGMLLAPIVRNIKGPLDGVLDSVKKSGFVRMRIDGEVFEMDALPKLDIRKPHTIEAVIDRVVVRENIQSRLTESLQLALKHGKGLAVFSYQDPKSSSDKPLWRDILFNTLRSCPTCKISFPEIEPRTFNFNSPHGACQGCSGLGWTDAFDIDLVLPDRSRSPANGAIFPWRHEHKSQQKQHQAFLESLCSLAGVRGDRCVTDWPADALEKFWQGTPESPGGLCQYLETEFRETTDAGYRQLLEFLRRETTCADCGGTRLRPEARTVTLDGKAIHEIARMTIDEGARWFEQELSLTGNRLHIARQPLAEILNRLKYLSRVGAGYLTLDRPADTLSGGELQRVRLATCIGTGLIGVSYVLDEPSVGLHPKDNELMIQVLQDLKEQGNTVLVVEHDEAIIRSADWIVDMGPGSGQFGGTVVVAGSPDDVATHAESITGKYLAGKLEVLPRTSRRTLNKKRMIVLEGATEHNLRNLRVEFPLGMLVCVTGVSGSGKSTLVNDTLARALARRLGLAAPRPGAYSRLSGGTEIQRLVVVDQIPIGRNARASLATFTGILDEIRRIFAKTRQARQRGYSPSRFSLNVKGGRCESCQGYGQRRVTMHLMPDVFVTCQACGGRRYNEQTLEVLFHEMSIADVLELGVQQAIPHFKSVPQVARMLDILDGVGLGYMPLGQSALTHSGGEAQRLKLAKELGQKEAGQTLYILDEPTRGLHFHEVHRLLLILDQLVDRGNSVLLVEHQLHMIRAADWVIDLGPDGGKGGGEVVAVGPPEEIPRSPRSHTGRFLKT